METKSSRKRATSTSRRTPRQANHAPAARITLTPPNSPRLCPIRRRSATSTEDRAHPDPAPEPAARLEAEEFHSRLRQELALLPEELATTFVLREIDQLSYAEIAQAMGTGEKTVSTRLHRARLRLRRRLSQWLREASA